MKKLLLVLFFFSVIFNSAGQTINETVDFINDAIMESTKSVLKLRFYDKIQVNDKGKITEDIYMKIIQPDFILMESRSGYLKNLRYSETKSFIDHDGTTHYIIILKSADGSNSVSRLIKTQDEVTKVDEINITVYSKELSEKVKTAVIHLLSLAKNNSKFLSKDIF
jgi:hypothetical protein